jgi:hypothetical protein
MRIDFYHPSAAKDPMAGIPAHPYDASDIGSGAARKRGIDHKI